MATRKPQLAEGIDLLKPKVKPMPVEDMTAQDLMAIVFVFGGASSKEAYDLADAMVLESRKRYD
jgi:hypothetical protein